MKNTLIKLNVLFYLLFLSFVLGCSDQDDDLGTTTSETADVTAQDFIWRAMNAFYFWQADVPNLADNRFTSNQEYLDFLASNPNPEDFFYSLCYEHQAVVGQTNAIDRFSVIVSDYNDLLALGTGEFATNGLDFGLIQLQNSNLIFGYVRYILPGSDAATKNIERGDLFLEVDGQQLTTGNYRQLLFGENDTYTLGLARVEGMDIVPTNETVTLNKTTFTENPILINETLDVNGASVGYLMYNSFTSGFDLELNDAFAQLRGVDELVLDLRYNGGGSVQSAIRLASMITGQFTGDLFLREQWNQKIQPIIDNPDNNFVNEINGTPINSLFLDKVYILTTSSSASASEQLISGLEPYIDVVHIGGTTTGKNEFSIPMVDNLDGTFFFQSADEVNPDNQYGLLPLVGRMSNADGAISSTNGIIPDIAYIEIDNLDNLGVLGQEDEPLLATAISDIRGTATLSFTSKNTMGTLMMDAKERTMIGKGAILFRN